MLGAVAVEDDALGRLDPVALRAREVGQVPTAHFVNRDVGEEHWRHRVGAVHAAALQRHQHSGSAAREPIKRDAGHAHVRSQRRVRPNRVLRAVPTHQPVPSEGTAGNR